MRIDWTQAPTAIIPKIYCPACGSDQRERKRTCDEGDGTRTRRYVCVDCDAPYKIVEEVPDRAEGLIWV